MNIDKYKNSGWGLSKKCFIEIERKLEKLEAPIIVEFGSGISTTFLIDYLKDRKKEGKVVSFENNKEFTLNNRDIKLNYCFRNLLECNDVDFENMFNAEKIDLSKFKKRVISAHTRQKNCFYEILKNDIPKKIDIVILDGPHGNGRSLAFLHIKEKINKGGIIVIDDYTHYDFIDRFKKIFPNSILIAESKTGKNNKWELGGDFKIFEIK